MGFYDQAYGNMSNELFNAAKTAVAVGVGYKHFANQQAQIDAAHLGNVEKLTADQKLNDLDIKKSSEDLSKAQEADKVAGEQVSSIENKLSELKDQYNYQKGVFDDNYAEYGRQSKFMKTAANDDEYFQAEDYRNFAAKRRDAAKDKMNNIEKDIQSQNIARSDALTYKAGTAAQLKEAGNYDKQLKIRQELLTKQVEREKKYLSKKALKEVNNGK